MCGCGGRNCFILRYRGCDGDFAINVFDGDLFRLKGATSDHFEGRFACFSCDVCSVMEYVSVLLPRL